MQCLAGDKGECVTKSTAVISAPENGCLTRLSVHAHVCGDLMKGGALTKAYIRLTRLSS
jgi:hypothetical protein